jgi:hypothetical protein
MFVAPTDPEASFVNGAVITVDGGMSARAQRPCSISDHVGAWLDFQDLEPGRPIVAELLTGASRTRSAPLVVLEGLPRTQKIYRHTASVGSSSRRAARRRAPAATRSSRNA